jgi:NAD(P)H dehydrogenase (quinone)
MHILIISANPNNHSFCNAIADRTIKTAQRLHHIVTSHNLYDEKFPPVLEHSEIRKNAGLPWIIRQHCADLKSADGIIIIHPNWWGQPPAILKGWIDRIIRPGVAYRFKNGDKGEGIPSGLLKARFAIVFNTSNTECNRERTVFKDPLETIWKNCIFGLCGINNFKRRTFGVIVTSSHDQRTRWLLEVESIVKQKCKSA